MNGNRRKYSPTEELALTTQVNGKCPICGRPLFYTKKSMSQKAYELAHIYPLNPKQSEIEELIDEQKMHEDANHPDNLLPLCRLCHTKFDNPRTVEEYQKLSEKKREFIRHNEQKEIQAVYQIENDVRIVIEGLYAISKAPESLDLEYDPKSLTDKFDNLMPMPTQQKIRHNVADYYQFIRTKFLEIDRGNPGASDLIYSQVKTYYLKQKSLGLPQQEVFSNIVQWFFVKTEPQTIEAAEIVTSFFIQNCEVFE